MGGGGGGQAGFSLPPPPPPPPPSLITIGHVKLSIWGGCKVVSFYFIPERFDEYIYTRELSFELIGGSIMKTNKGKSIL